VPGKGNFRLIWADTESCALYNLSSGDKSANVRIVGMAKEGLIKQHGGRKAAERIAGLLQTRISTCPPAFG
jgi:hypothetical protein